MMKMYFKKRIWSVAFLLFAGFVSAYAQKSVTGIVVDAFTGRPLPGVKVYESQGEVSAITGLDGSFRLESENVIRRVRTAYGGYTGFSKKGRPEMRMKMLKSGASYSDNTFVSFQTAVPGLVSVRPAFGLMAGWCRNVGGYVKGVFRGGEPEGVIHHLTDVSPKEMWTTGKNFATYNAVTAGLMLRLMSPVHLCFGIGGAWRNSYFEIAGGDWVMYDHRSYTSVVYDLGLAFKFGPVILNAGTLVSWEGCTGSFGIGYCF